ncbi:MAG: S8 family serine peptidase [Candidatus Coatesbacteria bacterium]
MVVILEFLPIQRVIAATPLEIVTIDYRGRMVETIAGEVILRFRPEVGEATRRQIASALGLRERLFLRFAPVGAYTILTGASVEAVMGAAAGVDGVVDAAPSFAAHALSCSVSCSGAPTACGLPDDFLYSTQLGHLGLTGIDQAWNDPSIYGANSNPDITIWVLDSGADPRHPDLVDKYRRDSQGNPFGLFVWQMGFSDFHDTDGHGTAVGSIAAASVNDRLTYTLPYVQVCDAIGGSGVQKALMPTTRRELAGAMVGTVIYAIGGRSSATILHGQVEAFDVEAGTWQTGLAAMPTARAQLAVANLGVSLFAIGGTTDFVDPLGAVEVYDPLAGC